MSNQLELDVRHMARHLYDTQVAFVFKVPEEMQQTPCDFFGFTTSGRAILIECKQVRAKSLKINGSPGLLPHQWRALRQAHECGAQALVIWRNGEHTAVLTYLDCLELSRGRKSIPWPSTVESLGHPWQEVLTFALTELMHIEPISRVERGAPSMN